MPSDQKRVPGLGSALVFAYLNRSFCYAQLGQFEKAKADGQKAMQLDPTAILNAFTQAIAKEPTQVLHCQNRAWFFLEIQDWQAALADCDKAIELDCTQMFSYSQRGAAHVGLKNFEQAVADYTRAIELDPTAGPAGWPGRTASFGQAIRSPQDLAARLVGSCWRKGNGVEVIVFRADGQFDYNHAPRAEWSAHEYHLGPQLHGMVLHWKMDDFRARCEFSTDFGTFVEVSDLRYTWTLEWCA